MVGSMTQGYSGIKGALRSTSWGAAPNLPLGQSSTLEKAPWCQGGTESCYMPPTSLPLTTPVGKVGAPVEHVPA